MKAHALLFFGFVLLGGCKEEAKYQGKPTSEWVEALSDRDVELRRQATRALGAIGADTRAVVPALAEALEDEDTEVRLRAAEVLAEIGPEARRAIPALVQTLKNEWEAVWGGDEVAAELYEHAYIALMKSGPEGASALLVTLTDFASSESYLDYLLPPIAFEVEQFRERVGTLPEATLEEIARALKHDDANHRALAALILETLGPLAESIVPAVVEVLQGQDAELKPRAQKILREMGPEVEELALREVPAFLAYPAMKNDLKNLAFQQRIYFAENNAYAKSLEALSGFVPSEGVIITLTSATVVGWAAMATHLTLGPGHGCAVFYGFGVVPPTLPGGAVFWEPEIVECDAADLWR